MCLLRVFFVCVGPHRDPSIVLVGLRSVSFVHIDLDSVPCLLDGPHIISFILVGPQ